MTRACGHHSIHITGTRVPVWVWQCPDTVPVLVGTAARDLGYPVGISVLWNWWILYYKHLLIPNSNRSGPHTVGMGQSQELQGRAHRPPKA